MHSGIGWGNSSMEGQLEEEFLEFWKQHREHPFIARNIIVKSLCPQIYGMYVCMYIFILIVCGIMTAILNLLVYIYIRIYISKFFTWKNLYISGFFTWKYIYGPTVYHHISNWAKREAKMDWKNKTKCNSIPSPFCRYLVKLAVMLVLVGGVAQHKTARGEGLKLRGSIHLLMVGDPGSFLWTHSILRRVLLLSPSHDYIIAPELYSPIAGAGTSNGILSTNQNNDGLLGCS